MEIRTLLLITVPALSVAPAPTQDMSYYDMVRAYTPEMTASSIRVEPTTAPAKLAVMSNIKPATNRIAPVHVAAVHVPAIPAISAAAPALSTMPISILADIVPINIAPMDISIAPGAPILVAEDIGIMTAASLATGTMAASSAVTTEPATIPAATIAAITPVTPPAPVMVEAEPEITPAPDYVYFDDAPTTTPATSAMPAALQAGSMAEIGSIVTLEQAISAALETNPEINQAIMNKEAIEFEREQAQGLYSPRVNLEASGGIRRLENRTRRAIGIDDDLLYPVEASIIAEQTIVDFGRRGGELRRQAARTDGAALRIVERSQNIALLVSRQYLDILLQQRVVAASDDNVIFHRNLVNDLGQGVDQGSISIADRQQAEERLQASIVRKTEAEEALVNAQISMQALTGLTVNGGVMPASLRAAAAPTLGDAVAMARQNNPKVKEAMADVDAAHALAEKEKGDLYPTIGAEVRGRVGNDIDGFSGHTNDVQGRIVLRWNIFDGGINRAKYQEMIRRASEARFRLHELTRYAVEDVQRAWNSMSTQGKVVDELAVQSSVSDDLLQSYREQFNIGRRSLLDVLDAQNTRYNVQVRLETARFSKQFSEYQVLAATNNLLEAMGLNAPASGNSDARGQFDYGPSAPAELQRRRYPR